MDSSLITIEPPVTATACQNNDWGENSTERRKEALLKAMQEHPELFWKSRNNKDDHENTKTTEGINPIIILESTDDAQDEPDAAAAITTTTSSKIRSLDVETLLWKSIQELLNEKFTTGDFDDVDNNSAFPSSSSTVRRLRRFQSSLDGVLRGLAVVDNHRMEVGDDFSCTDHHMAARSKDVAKKLVHDSAKDLCHIIQSMIDEIAVTSDDHDDKNNTNPKRNESAGDFTNDVLLGFPTIEEWVLLCSEDFPEEKGTPNDDDDDDNSDNYFENLETRSATFTNAGNTNDPLVHNLICNEKGFFEGDDAVVLEEGNISKEAELDVHQQLLLVQETTRMIRVKTLELARQRLKRQNN
jgi:hypothetical protein